MSINAAARLGDASGVAVTADEQSLTPADQALVEHVQRGEVLDLAGDGPLDEAAMLVWDDTHTISATVIRDILRGLHVDDPDPHGLRLRGARIDGRLDLENISSVIRLKLIDCLLAAGMNARDADLGVLALTGCRLSHPTEPPLDGTRLTAAVVYLSRTTIDAHCPQGAVHLPDARLGELICDGVRLVNDSGLALAADRMRVVRSVSIHKGSVAIGAGKMGGPVARCPYRRATRLFRVAVGQLSEVPWCSTRTSWITSPPGSSWSVLMA